MSKRKLRSDTAAERGEDKIVVQHPPAKKAKTEVVRYLCTSCDTNRVAGVFPVYNPSSECEHSIHTCKPCLKTWVNVQIDTAQFATVPEDARALGVKCPECPALMRNVNIQIATTRMMHAKFEKIERKHIGESIPGWRWCFAPKCDGGQVHRNPEEPPKTKSRSKNEEADPETDVEDICTCNKCGARACVTCDRPYHEGETCSAYQARLEQHMAEDEDKSLRAINQIAKKCPKCNKNIQKSGGCSVMLCTSCRTQFCWECMESFKEGLCACSRSFMPML